MEAILFLEVPGPGALARFMERRGGDDPDPVDVWLTDALGPSTRRALFGPGSGQKFDTRCVCRALPLARACTRAATSVGAGGCRVSRG
ncbi:MAG: hypothetical protein ACKO5K_07545, partial [Armatimonadota bacterium]